MTTITGRRGAVDEDGAERKRQKGAGSRKDVDASPRGAIVVGVEPRVDLLPPEVRASRKRDALVRRLVVTLVIVIALMIAAVGGSAFFAIQSQQALAAEQAKTLELAQQQQKYGVVKQVQSQIGLTEAAQQVGASTEIDWNQFLAKAKATLPQGVTLTGISIDSASPLAPYQQSTIPLQGTRVAAVTLDVTSATLPDLPTWLRALAKLPGVADTAPGAVTLSEGGAYTATATIHLNESAYDNRFNTKEGK
jgi:Tfp pilus assembly protein PilN